MYLSILYKRFISLFFLVSFLCQSFNSAFIIADYKLNTGMYAKNCVNKAKPKLRCNGKCQMMKKIQEEEKKDAENAERKSENKNEVILSSKSFFANADMILSKTLIITTYTTFSFSNTIDRAYGIFHPPQV